MSMIDNIYVEVHALHTPSSAILHLVALEVRNVFHHFHKPLSNICSVYIVLMIGAKKSV